MPLLRFVGNFKNDLSERVASRHLLLRLHRFRKRECLRHRYFDFLVIDQLADLDELFRRRSAAARGRAVSTYCVLASA
jgi:hypothetical protein